jgi:malate dehydrogenase (quinone)
MKYDVIIVGGGVSGTALLYTLCKYTDVRYIGLIEKYDDLGLVNSASNMNSQTLHFGDIETNYTLEKAKKVKRSADMVMRYLEAEKKENREEKIFIKVPKMVLAVGKEQVETLRERFKPILSILKITSDKIIFNITPSPGASTCLGNAYEDTIRIMEFLKQRYSFKKEKFEQDLFQSPDENLKNGLKTREISSGSKIA